MSRVVGQCGEGLMWSPLCRWGGHFSRSGRWSVKGEGDSGRGEGFRGRAAQLGWRPRGEAKRMVRTGRGLARCGKLEEEREL